MAVPAFPHRTAFVTGASAGLGRALVRMLRAEGVRVWGTARAADRLSEFAADTDFVAVALDLADAEQAAAIFSRANTEAGGFDIVINNAGYGVFGRFDASDFRVWQFQVDAMLTTTARVSHLALRSMR